MTDRITNLVAEICEQVGRITVLSHGCLNPHLRKANRIRTIRSSLAIEGNTLSLEQVTAILDGRRVLGNPVEIKEVRNAESAYDLMLSLDPASVDDLLKAHGLMMDGLIPENGRFRSGGVGVFAGNEVVHIAPPAGLVPGQIRDLIGWYQKSEMHPLVKSSVFHYEFEFVHPFADGNGRMGRMWHSLLLGTWNELFFWLPVEDMIRARQSEYYGALERAGGEGDCAAFVQFMLEAMLDTLRDTEVVGGADVSPEPIRRLLDAMGDETLSAAEIMARMGLSHRPSFRKSHLVPALKAGVIEMTDPDRPNSSNQRYRRRREGRRPTKYRSSTDQVCAPLR